MIKCKYCGTEHKRVTIPNSDIIILDRNLKELGPLSTCCDLHMKEDYGHFMEKFGVIYLYKAMGI